MAVLAGGERRAAAPSLGRSWSVDRPVQWLIALVAVALVVFPLAPILYQSVLDKPLYESGRSLTLDNFSRILGSHEFRHTLLTTLGFAALTTALAVPAATVLAVLLTRTDVPGRG